MTVLSVQHAHGYCISCISSDSVGTTSVISDTVWRAFSFVAPANPFGGTMCLKDFTCYYSAVGAAGTDKVTAKLCADASGIPNSGTVVESATETGAISAATWVTHTFAGTTALTEGVQYWIFLVRTAGTSATVQCDNMTKTGWGYGMGGSSAGSGYSHGFVSVGTVDSGTAWATAPVARVAGFRVGLTDGTDTAYLGVPTGIATAAVGATEKLYTNTGAAQEVGSQFTLPSGTSIKVRAISMYIKKNTTPSGSVRFRLYTGSSPSLQATSTLIPPGVITNGAVYTAYLSSSITIAGGTVVTVTAGNDSADSSSAYHYTLKNAIHDDADSKALLLFGGVQAAKLSGTTWTYVDTEMVPFTLILDTSGEFSASSAGSFLYGDRTGGKY